MGERLEEEGGGGGGEVLGSGVLEWGVWVLGMGTSLDCYAVADTVPGKDGGGDG